MKWITIITEKNSVYRNLGNGKTQRFKRATNETCAIQDLLVFIEPMTNSKLQLFLQAVQLRGEFGKVYLIDKGGNTYDSVNLQVPELKLAILKNNQWVNFAKVSITPIIGWYTFDQRRFQENNISYRECHIGNKVIHIE